jgi:hypothetical protein
MHGRLRPYNKYLQWELEHFPLPGDWNAALMPTRVFAQASGLFPAVEALARHHGHTDVLDAWGSDFELIRTFAAGAARRGVTDTSPHPEHSGHDQVTS